MIDETMKEETLKFLNNAQIFNNIVRSKALEYAIHVMLLELGKNPKATHIEYMYDSVQVVIADDTGVRDFVSLSPEEIAMNPIEWNKYVYGGK